MVMKKTRSDFGLPGSVSLRRPRDISRILGFTTGGRTEDGSIHSRTPARQSPGGTDSYEKIFLTLFFVFLRISPDFDPRSLEVFSFSLRKPPKDSLRIEPPNTKIFSLCGFRLLSCGSIRRDYYLVTFIRAMRSWRMADNGFTLFFSRSMSRDFAGAIVCCRIVLGKLFWF